MKNIYDDRVFTKKTKVIIPLWKWVLLYFTRTYKNVDLDGCYTTIIYVKILFKKMYIWKRETFNAGKLIEKSKLKRKEVLCI